MLHQLKREGVNQADLITVYISVVIPVVEYACPVWHTDLSICLLDNDEMIQKRYIVSLQYLSRSSLHRLAGVPCRIFLSYIMVSKW